jgi:hypothetical protein
MSSARVALISHRSCLIHVYKTNDVSAEKTHAKGAYVFTERMSRQKHIHLLYTWAFASLW